VTTTELLLSQLFCDFANLRIPGTELQCPSSQALNKMISVRFMCLTGNNTCLDTYACWTIPELCLLSTMGQYLHNKQCSMSLHLPSIPGVDLSRSQDVLSQETGGIGGVVSLLFMTMVLVTDRMYCTSRD
jgi:hypothetical protein